jgi:hypothetical protein
MHLLSVDFFFRYLALFLASIMPFAFMSPSPEGEGWGEGLCLYRSFSFSTLRHHHGYPLSVIAFIFPFGSNRY